MKAERKAIIDNIESIKKRKAQTVSRLRRYIKFYFYSFRKYRI
jgi:hypothetical protein